VALRPTFIPKRSACPVVSWPFEPQNPTLRCRSHACYLARSFEHRCHLSASQSPLVVPLALALLLGHARTTNPGGATLGVPLRRSWCGWPDGVPPPSCSGPSVRSQVALLISRSARFVANPALSCSNRSKPIQHPFRKATLGLLELTAWAAHIRWDRCALGTSRCLSASSRLSDGMNGPKPCPSPLAGPHPSECLSLTAEAVHPGEPVCLGAEALIGCQATRPR
jgi:hypothetical protein